VRKKKRETKWGIQGKVVSRNRQLNDTFQGEQ